MARLDEDAVRRAELAKRLHAAQAVLVASGHPGSITDSAKAALDVVKDAPSKPVLEG